MDENFRQAAAAYITNWLFKKHRAHAVAEFQDKTTAYAYALFYANQIEVNADYSEHACVNYLITILKEKFNSDRRADMGLNKSGQKQFPAAVDPEVLKDTLSVEDKLVGDVDKQARAANQLAIVVKRLKDYDEKYGFNYLDRFYKFQEVGFSDSEAARRFGASRQSWNFFKQKIIDITTGAPPRLRRDRREKLEKK